MQSHSMVRPKASRLTHKTILPTDARQMSQSSLAMWLVTVALVVIVVVGALWLAASQDQKKQGKTTTAHVGALD